MARKTRRTSPTPSRFGRNGVITFTFYALTGVIGAATYEPALEGRLKPFFIATAIYLFVSLVLTHSKHVQRLTSRMWE